MIDLSFLTEEEQETILAVLKRDADLKKAEEKRVKKLQRSASNKGRLKYLTGEWFYETKSLRHQDRIHGSDIIRASMRHAHKPLTILELSQMLPERPSFVSSDNQEVFVPPQLSGLIQEPHMQLSNENRNQNWNPFVKPQEIPVSQSPSKQRQNPFNSEPLAPLEENDSQLVDGPVEQTRTPGGEPLPSYDHCISYATNLNQDQPKDSPVAQNAPVPMPKTRIVINRSQDSLIEVDGLAGRQTNSAAPRGILKHVSSSSSADSLYSRLGTNSPSSLDSPTETIITIDREAPGWIDRKQVRFCSAFGWSGVEWQHGKEPGEHSLLDVASEEENSTELEDTGSTIAGTHRPLLKQRQVDLDDGDLSCERGADLQNQEAVPHQVPGDLCEHCDTELLSPQVSNPFSAEQESGKPVHLETEREEDGLSKAKATDWLTGHSIHQPQPKLPEQSGDNLDIFVEATADTKPSSNGSSNNSSHAVSPKPRKGLLGIFSRGEAKEKTAELQSPHKEEVKLSKQKELDDTLNHSSPSAANITEDNQMNFGTPGTTEFRTLQLTALQNNQFVETMTSLGSDLDTQQEPTEGKDSDTKFPRRLSNLKAFWERGNSDPKVIFTREQARHEDSPKTETEDPQNVQIHSILESKTDNFSTQMELTEECRTKDNVAQSHEEIPSPQIESSILLDLPEEDGTYRANPILISEETDDSLTGSITDSQIPEPQENVTAPLPISLSCNIPQQKGNRPVPLPRQSCLQENRPTVINQESSGTRVIVGRVTEASGSPIHSKCIGLPFHSSSGQTMHHNNKVVTSHSDLRTSLSSREKSEEEAQNSSHNTKSNVVSNTKHVTDKGFVSHSSDKSQLRSSGIPGNVGSTYQQYQLKTEIESVLPQERPLSPSRAQTPRSKDSTDDEVRRSPSKTCHPKALPRDPSSSKGSSLEGSPLKTFPIDIAPPTKAHEEQSGRPTPAARQRKSPSHEAQLSGLMVIKPSTEIITRSLLLEPEDDEQHHLTLSPSVDAVQSLTHSARRSKFGNVNTQQSSQSATTGLQSGKTSESANIGPAQLPGSSKKLGTVTQFARSVIPRDYQHYLGAPEKTHLPPFHQEKVGEESNVKLLAPSPAPAAVHRPQSPFRDFEGNQDNSTIERNHSRISSWIVQNTDSNSSQDRTTGSWSQTRASSNSYDDDSSPLRSALKRISSRSMSSSKSLENLTSQMREERSKNNPRGQLNLSVDDASSVSDSEQMKKMSVSVPVFQQEEMDSDSASEHMGWRRNTGSSMSNISLSSGMASMASMSSVSGSVTSIYPADFGDIEVQGTIQFAVNYVQQLGEFHIFVVHCRDLAVAEPKKNRSNPYVKCYLLPDQTKLRKRKTSVKKKTLNPTYNEILRFKIIMEVLKTQKLNISVWHSDTFGRNSFLGEVDLDLSEWDFSNTQINDFALKARVPAPISASSPSRSVDTRGQMRVALRFLQQITHSKMTSKMETGEVQIWVKDCKNLPPVRGVIIDPFVKCTVLPDTSRKSRQKTRVVKRTANPMFNHTMVYDGFRPEDLREACVEITVWDHDRLSNHYIGGLRLGPGTGKSYGAEAAWMDSTTDEANLWERMMQSHGEWVEDVLPLRMLMMAKSMSK